MKQNITSEQIEELPHYQKKRLREWCDIVSTEGKLSFNEYHDGIPLLTIGQMIGLNNYRLKEQKGEAYYQFKDIIADIEVWDLDELCDALWEDIKYYLK